MNTEDIPRDEFDKDLKGRFEEETGWNYEQHFERYSQWLEKKYKEDTQRLLDSLLCAEHITMHIQEIPDDLDTDKEKKLQTAINKMYRLSHVARKPSCMSSHEDWEDELQETIKIIKEHF